MAKLKLSRRRSIEESGWTNLLRLLIANAAPYSYNIALTSTVSQTIQPRIAVPEHTSLGLLGIGLMAMGFVRRRLQD